jgi:hypothetical protein
MEEAMRSLVALIVLLLPWPALAEGRLVHAFTLYLGGIRAAEMEVTAEWDGTRFTGRSELRTVGLVGVLWSGFYRVAAEGRVAGTLFAPGRFVADSAFDDDRQRVLVAYEDGRPRVLEADPPFRRRAWEIAPEAQGGTLDPFAAALTLIRPEPVGAICNRSVEVFDGRRRTRITLGAPRNAEDGIRCPGTYTRVAGFSPRTMKKGEDFPFTVVFRANGDGLAEIWQVYARTDFGVAVARRREG